VTLTLQHSRDFRNRVANELVALADQVRSVPRNLSAFEDHQPQRIQAEIWMTKETVIRDDDRFVGHLNVW
jgi:hypothetical protein